VLGLNAVSTTCTLYVPGLGRDAPATIAAFSPNRSVPLLKWLLSATLFRPADGLYSPGPGADRLSTLGSSGGPVWSSARAKDPVVPAT